MYEVAIVILLIIALGLGTCRITAGAFLAVMLFLSSGTWAIVEMIDML